MLIMIIILAMLDLSNHDTTTQNKNSAIQKVRIPIIIIIDFSFRIFQITLKYFFY